jgi:hypothetical protein
LRFEWEKAPKKIKKKIVKSGKSVSGNVFKEY